MPRADRVLYTQDATWECHISLWQVASCFYAHRIQVNTYDSQAEELDGEMWKANLFYNGPWAV